MQKNDFLLLKYLKCPALQSTYHQQPTDLNSAASKEDAGELEPRPPASVLLREDLRREPWPSGASAHQEKIALPMHNFLTGSSFAMSLSDLSMFWSGTRTF